MHLCIAALFMLVCAKISFAEEFENQGYNYSSGLYEPSAYDNGDFYRVYYKNKINMIFNDLEKHKNKNAMFMKFDSEGDDVDTVNIVSPVVHPNSRVKTIMINNKINGDVSVRDED
jgi:type II restriction/modification system DNA methylase subunit YeeA